MKRKTNRKLLIYENEIRFRQLMSLESQISQLEPFNDSDEQMELRKVRVFQLI